MKLQGIITAMVTPFNEDMSINYEATKQLVDRLIDGGVYGIFVLGTNGEFHVMSDDEKVAYCQKVVEFANHRVPVFAGPGGNSTTEVIELAKRMEAAGVDALSVISPFFVGLSEEELYTHYTKIADAVNIPIILYNIPKNTGINLSPELIGKLSAHPNIIGIKDSKGDVEQMAAYVEAAKGNDFAVLSGSDSKILAALKIGAVGAVAATSNVLTKNNLAIYENFQKSNLEEAQKWQDSLEEFRRILKYSTIPTVLKKSIELTGIKVGTPRPPVLPLTDEAALKDINDVIAAYGLKQ